MKTKTIHPKDIEALKMRMIEGMTEAEIGKAQGVSQTSAGIRIHKAAEYLGLDNIEDIRDFIFNKTYGKFLRSLDRNLSKGNPMVTVSYAKGNFPILLIRVRRNFAIIQ